MNKKTNNYIKDEKEIIDKEFELVCRLIEIRKNKQLSQRELCGLIGFSQPMLARIEKGKQSPSLNTLIKILISLGYEIELKKSN